MIDPHRITDFSRTDEQLEELILFCVFVCNKNADTTSVKLEKFLERSDRPFDKVREYIRDGILLDKLKDIGTGQYTRIMRALTGLVSSGINLRTCSAEELESIVGIGRKTSRFFILHTRPDSTVAVLDTHILKYLKDCDIENVPVGTPGSMKSYLRLEREFLKCAERDRGTMSLAEFDLSLWCRYRGSEF